MGKIVSLEESVKNVIQPNISLHFSFTHNRPMAYAWEIIRQYRAQKLDLHVVGTGMLEYAIALIWAGHVKKLEGAFFGETYPAPRPNRLIMKLARDGKLDIEYWTNLTIPQRFMAQANGWDYIPTRSLQNTDLLSDHLESGKAFKVKDPLSGEEMVMIRGLQPDVTVVHGSVADTEGNTVVTPPYGEDLWGVFASKKVVVLVEKIVNSETIQSLSHLVKIPAHKVDYVAEVPMGAHPYGTSPIGFSDMAYGEDYKFRNNFSQAIRDKVDIDSWMLKWGLDQSHEVYLDKLGKGRINDLKTTLGVKSSKTNTTSTRKYEPATSAEKLVIAASRLIAEKAKEEKIETMLAGIGLSHLTAWLVYKRLTEEGHKIRLLTETGYYDYDPVEGDPYIFNFGNLYTNRKQSSFVEILGQFVGDGAHPCLAILSGAQIDEHGNLNSTAIPEKNLFLTGSGGANDIASVATDVVAMMNGDYKKFVQKVPYITSAGDKVSTIFTNAGILEREDVNQPFTVRHWIPDSEVEGLEQYRKKINDLLPWNVKIDDDAAIMQEPCEQELSWLRAFDPEGEFLQ